MNRKIFAGISWIVLMGLLFSCVTSKSGKAELHAWFPSALGEGWQASSKVASYSPETIFDYIDGEAEMYFPYGFQQAFTRTYKNNNNLIVADVYVMGSLLDAFGIFSNYRSPNSECYEIGAEGFVDDYQLMFYKGPYFVRITAVGNPVECADVLRKCAKMIDAAIPDKPKPPVELDVFQIPAVDFRTVRYVARSVVGYPFFKRGFVANFAVDENKARLVVIPAETAEEAKNVLSDYADFIKKSGGTCETNGNLLAGTDPLYKNVYFLVHNTVILGVIDSTSTEAPEAFLQEVAERASEVFASQKLADGS